MRIVIDMQGAQSASRFRGIGRYSLSLALAIARNAEEHEIWLALSGAFPESILSIRRSFEGLIPPERIRVFEVPSPLAEVDIGNAWRVRAAEHIREYFLQQLKPDVVLVSSLFEGYRDDAVTSIGRNASGMTTVVILYDLIPLLNQKAYLADEAQCNCYMRKVSSLKNADMLLAISESSRREVIKSLLVSQNQVVNISAAVDSQFRCLDLPRERVRQLRRKFSLERKVVMYAPGGFDERKNIEGLITAYSMLPTVIRDEHQLVIVGNISPDCERNLQKLAKISGVSSDEIVITGYISDDELVELFNLATLFVFPSKHEGFGLPVLEAMACGTPVICSNNSSLPEVINFPDALFDPFSPSDMANKIAQALCEQSFQERLRNHGLEQSKKFSWDTCAKRAIIALEVLKKTKETASEFSETVDDMSELVQSIASIDDCGPPANFDIFRVAECLASSVKRDGSRQLFLDISVIVHGDAKSGIQRVVRSLLREFIESPPADVDVRPIYFDGVCYKYANTFINKFLGSPSNNMEDEVVGFYQDDIYLALDLNAHLTAAVHDLHMRLQCRGIKMYFIVYDILLVQRPDWWPEGTSVIFEAWLKSISEVATELVCISEAVAEEVRTWLKQNPTQRLSDPVVSSFHLGADVENSLPSKGLPENALSVLAALSLSPGFLMVGTLEPRKGHTQTLAAFELLWAHGSDAKLVVVGKRGWLVDPLVEKLNRHPELNQRLFWLEGISDEYLERVYAACSCLIAPSEGEGFGLPLIEAAQYNLPIIARDIPVFREVAGEYAFYFSGKDSDALANAIQVWLELYRVGKHPKSDSMPWLTWRQSAENLLKRVLFSR